MTLSPAPRRFRDTIARLRETPAERNSAGEFVEGATVETELAASVQPISLTDADIAAGVGLVERYKVFVGEADAPGTANRCEGTARFARGLHSAVRSTGPYVRRR